MRQTLLWDRGKGHLAALLGVIPVLFICLGIEWANPSIPVAFAHLQTPVHQAIAASSCPKPTKPDANSLLVVLLDRSGSLIDQPGATDPNHYSTSVTKALADLWPGKMAVIPFKGDTAPLKQIGPLAMSDPTQRDSLKNQIPEADPNGNTPLGAAMDQTLSIFKTAGVPSGSRVVLITDGEPNTTSDPDGSQEEAHIRNDLLKRFCQQGIPVSPFGLEINDPRANTLLSDIATGTGGSYKKVQSPEQLAQNVIQLYNNWLNLSLSQPTRDTDGSYSVFINDFASHADIVVFRSDLSYSVTLFGSDGKTPVSGIQAGSIDAHYEIYSLDMTAFSPGIYKIKVENKNGLDSAAQVYALADHPLLQVKLISPDVLTISTGQALTIRAALYKGQKQYVPSGVATLTADITYHVSGQADTTITENLTQQGQGIFSHQFPPYTQPGQLRIIVHAQYQGIQEDSRVITLQLVMPPPGPCNKGQWQCFWEQHHTEILSRGIPLALLLVLLIGLLIWFSIWKGQPAPYGWLVDMNKKNALELGKYRPLSEKLLSKSVVTLNELEKHPDAIGTFSFSGASAQFVFKPDGVYLRRNGSNLVDVSVRTSTQEVKLSDPNPEVLLQPGSILKIGNHPIGTFQTSAPQIQGRPGLIWE